MKKNHIRNNQLYYSFTHSPAPYSIRMGEAFFTA